MKIKKYFFNFITYFSITFIVNIIVTGAWNYMKYRQCGMIDIAQSLVLALILSLILTINNKK